MVLPMLVLPFVVGIFWSLGGGQGPVKTVSQDDRKGINARLPDAQMEETPWNKLALYDKAVRDSLKFKEQQQSDPYVELPPVSIDSEARALQTSIPYRSLPIPENGKPYVDPNEARVNEKLNELYKELNKSNSVETESLAARNPERMNDNQVSADVKKLEEMMEMMNSERSEDPEMQQIGGMLDKILDIQHPDRVRNRIIEESANKRGLVFPVDVLEENIDVSLLCSGGFSDSTNVDEANQNSFLRNKFYGVGDEKEISREYSNTVLAVVHDTQELVDGATVKMRLLDDVAINGRWIAKGQFVFGTAAINGERLSVKINSIRESTSVFPVSLSAFDLDGLEGIHIPGAIERDVAKQSSDQAMQSLQFMTMDQSLGAQAASAGIQAAKGLFSKKVKLVKVTVKAGYQVLLRDQNDRS